MFKFYLDNTLVEDPINWDDFSETIERDDTIKGLLPKYEVKLKFNGSGYEYLFNALLQSGFCRLVELRVDFATDSINYNTILNGYIFLTESIFNLNKAIVDCEVEDNNYGARIYRNKSIKVYLDTDKTKNGEDLTACTTLDVQLFDPVGGAYSGSDRKCYKIKDAMRFLIEFMTDNLVGFESDYLDTIDLSGITLISGSGLRSPSQATAPFVSFEDLFNEINKKFPISFTIIKGADGRPTMKVEEDAYFFNETSVIQINNINDLRQSFDSEILYSSVKFGGKTVDFDAALHHFGYIRFLAFKEEQYFLTGNCNIDKTLDLFSDFVCDSNIIEELFVTATSNDSYDTDNFFLCTDGIDKASIYDSPTTGGSPYYFNGLLTNDKVSSRYNYNGSLALYLSGAILGFRASKEPANALQNANNHSFPVGGAPCPTPPEFRSYTSTGVFVEFNDDSTTPNYNTAGNYNTGLYRYYCSVAGDHVFETQIKYTASPAALTLFNMYYKGIVEFRRYNAGGTLMQTSSTEDPISPSGFYSSSTSHFISHSAFFTLDVGDYVAVAFWYLYCPVNCTVESSIIMNIRGGIDNTWFRTTAAPTSGGVYQNVDTRPYLASRFKFECPISAYTFNTLKLDLSKSIIFNHQQLQNKVGWIRKFSRKYATGATDIELISNINNSN